MMILPVVAVVAGLVLLVWSAERFVDGAAATSRRLGLSPLLVGMLVIGFGTSAPELMVSALAASQGNPGLALGNAYGSNIANIGLILGLVALISPLAVHSGVVRRELPVLAVVTLLSALLIWGGVIGRLEGGLLLLLLAAFIGVSIILSRREGAEGFGVSDLIIGLTVVAVGRRRGSAARLEPDDGHDLHDGGLCPRLARPAGLHQPPGRRRALDHVPDIYRLDGESGGVRGWLRGPELPAAFPMRQDDTVCWSTSCWFSRLMACWTSVPMSKARVFSANVDTSFGQWSRLVLFVD